MSRFSLGLKGIDCVHSMFPLCFCSHCNDCRELDLCRDPALQKGSWACPCCQAEYDAAAIEARLVAALQGRIKEFVLQDLSCTQCKQVCRSAAGNMPIPCSLILMQFRLQLCLTHATQRCNASSVLAPACYPPGAHNVPRFHWTAAVALLWWDTVEGRYLTCMVLAGACVDHVSTQ